jgi:hypothetical protein
MGNQKSIQIPNYIVTEDGKQSYHMTYRLGFKATLVEKILNPEMSYEKSFIPFPKSDIQIYPLQNFIHFLGPISPDKQFKVISDNGFTYIFKEVKILELVAPFICCCELAKNHFEIDWYIKDEKDTIKTVEFEELVSPTCPTLAASSRSDVRCVHKAEWCVRPRDRTNSGLCLYHHCVKYEPNAVFGEPEYEFEELAGVNY